VKKAISERYQVLVAPLGELPDGKAIEEFAKEAEKAERIWQLRGWSAFLDIKKDLAELTRRVLEKVRDEEGIRFSQVDQANLAGSAPQQGKILPILTAVGVHGERSAYIVHYMGAPIDHEEKRSYSPIQVFKRFSHHRELYAQLSALEEKLFKRYPALWEAYQKEKSPPPTLIEAVKVGQVAFVIDIAGYVRYAIVGETAISVSTVQGSKDRRLYRWEKVLEVGEKTLTKVLRDRSILGLLPAKAVRDLLRGKGDPKEVERAVGLDRLSKF
jgi:hypothetical protein